MARTDQLRMEIARLESKRADLAGDVAKHEKTAASAREAGRKKREQASRSKGASTVRMNLTAAEREEKKAADAESKAAKARKDGSAVDKNVSTKKSSLSSAEASEKRAADSARKREDSRRRRDELEHAHAVARASNPPIQVRYIEVTPLRVPGWNSRSSRAAIAVHWTPI